METIFSSKVKIKLNVSPPTVEIELGGRVIGAMDNVGWKTKTQAVKFLCAWIQHRLVDSVTIIFMDFTVVLHVGHSALRLLHNNDNHR